MEFKFLQNNSSYSAPLEISILFSNKRIFFFQKSVTLHVKLLSRVSFPPNSKPKKKKKKKKKKETNRQTKRLVTMHVKGFLRMCVTPCVTFTFHVHAQLPLIWTVTEPGQTHPVQHN